jgi:hypothetical protein
MRIAARVKRHCSLPRLSLICGILSFLGTVLASPLLLDDWAHVAGPAPPAVLAVPLVAVSGFIAGAASAPNSYMASKEKHWGMWLNALALLVALTLVTLFAAA